MKITLSTLVHIADYISNAGGVCLAFSCLGSRAARRYGEKGMQTFKTRLRLMRTLCDLSELKDAPSVSERITLEISGILKKIWREEWRYLDEREFQVPEHIKKAVQAKLDALSDEEKHDLNSFFSSVSLIQCDTDPVVKELARKGLYEEDFSAYQRYIKSLTLPHDGEESYQADLKAVQVALSEAKIRGDQNAIVRLAEKVQHYEEGEAKIARFIHTHTDESLKEFFKKWQEALKLHARPLTLAFGISTHEMSFTYAPEKQCWFFVNIGTKEVLDISIFDLDHLVSCIRTGLFFGNNKEMTMTCDAIVEPQDVDHFSDVNWNEFNPIVQPAEGKEATKRLYFACYNQDVKLAELLLKQGADPNNCDYPCDYPLHEAVRSRNKELVTLLLESKANPNIFVQSGKTPLTLAVQLDLPEIMDCLLTAGASSSLSTYGALLPRRVLKSKCSEKLLASGDILPAERLRDSAFLSILANQPTIFELDGWIAEASPRRRVITALKTNTVELDRFEEFDLVAQALRKLADYYRNILPSEKFLQLKKLIEASYNDFLQNAEITYDFLLQEAMIIFSDHPYEVKHQSEQKSEDQFAIRSAVKAKYLDIVKSLLGQTHQSHLPAVQDRLCRRAIKWGLLDVVRFLVEEQNHRPDALLKEAISAGYCHVVRYLLDKNFMCRVGKQELFEFAAQIGKFEIVKIFVEEQKIDVNHVVRDPALNLAALNGHLSVVKYLIGQNATIDIPDNYGHTALHEAVINSKFDCIKFLLAAGATINSIDKNNQTVLHIAVMRKNLIIVKFLIEHKADLRIVSKNGMTALQLAEKNRKIEIVNYLKGLNKIDDKENGVTGVAANPILDAKNDMPEDLQRQAKLILHEGEAKDVGAAQNLTAMQPAVKKEGDADAKCAQEAISVLNTKKYTTQDLQRRTFVNSVNAILQEVQTKETKDARCIQALATMQAEVKKAEDAKCTQEAVEVLQENLFCHLKALGQWHKATEIRGNALKNLKQQVADEKSSEKKLCILTKAKIKPLFYEHRNSSFFSGAFGRTQTIIQIDNMIRAIEIPEREARRLFTLIR
jgi:ankyrin repeat protein